MLSTQYKSLYPVDLSKRCTLPMHYVKVWAERFRAVLDTLYIVNNDTSAGSMLWLEQARDLFGSSVKLFRTSGGVIAAIRDVAKEIKADLVELIGAQNALRPEVVS